METTTTESDTTTSTTTSSTTTTTLPNPPTTLTPASTTSEATTTTVELTPDLTAGLFFITIESSRDVILEVWADDINVESVDGFVVEYTNPNDPTSLTVILDVTSGWASEDNQHDGAWEISRAMAVLWHPEDGAYYNEVWQPVFRLVNSGRTYECPGEFMVQLADARASRMEWETTCAA